MGPFRTSQLTQEQMAAFLHDAVSEIRRWKQMLRENYRDMHAAVIKAFPLRECLEKEGEKRRIIRPTRLLITPRESPWWTMCWRTACRALGPNSPVGVLPC
jgi:hypothetical protein